jgi:hypothetical protein
MEDYRQSCKCADNGGMDNLNSGKTKWCLKVYIEVILHNFHVLIMAAKRRNTIEVFQQYE